MTELRDVIAKNIYELRTSAEMTQLALAEVLNYSDKAVSKWERAESVPDVFMLKRIADYFYLKKANERFQEVQEIVKGVVAYGKQASAHISIYYAMYLYE